MPLRDDILNPIAGDNPSGLYLRNDPVYDKIKEARREDDELAQGDWKHDRKLADHALVIKLIQEVLATKTKDLQLAVWLTESLLRKNGFQGFCDGIVLCRNLVETFWDTLYPEIEDGDAEFRAAPLNWIGSKMDFPLKSVPLCAAGYDFYRYKESRVVGYDDQAKDKDQKKTRELAVKGGKLAPEEFDKSFGETPKLFYAQAEIQLDVCIVEMQALDKCCAEKFGEAAPFFGKLKPALEEVRHVVHGFLQKKRELEPDPVEDIPVGTVSEKAADAGVETSTDGVAQKTSGYVIQAPEDPADRKEMIAAVVAAAAFLRKKEPKSPAPYLMLRGLRWGELRAAIEAKDYSKLEAPPTDVRRLIKKLAMDGKWKDLIDAAENVMGLPCSRAWLDLQRFVVEGCIALGPDYQLIAIALRSELRGLIRDVPQILDLTLTDDTAAANASTQAWLRTISEEPESATPAKLPADAFVLDAPQATAWKQKFVDSYDLAVQAVRAGQEARAFEILHAEIQSQTSGRGRFIRRLQMVQLCAATGKESIMQPFLDDLIATVENHKLEEWEDRGMIAAALVTIINASKKIQGDAKEKQKLFERICRLDPAQALGAG